VTPPRTELLRRLLASAGALVAAVLLRSFDDDLPVMLWLPAGLLAGAAILIHHRYLGSQLLARAALWSNLLLGCLIAVMTRGDGDWMLGAGLAVATGGALLCLGGRGLGADVRAGRFVPLAHRTLLTATLILALADAQGLLFWGGLEVEFGEPSARPFVCGALMLVAVIGLYRLRTWGFLLNLVANLAIAAMALAGALPLEGPVPALLAATAILQLLIAAPVLRSLAVGAPVTEASPRSAGLAASLVVIALVLVALGARLFA
jgi:hypothetical protein